jgi:hypothetical protein
MYPLADRMVIGLKALAKCKVKQTVLQRLDKFSFQAAVSRIYYSTPATDRGLRDLVVWMTLDNLGELMAVTEAAAATIDGVFLKLVPQFSCDVLATFIDTPASSRRMNKYGFHWNFRTCLRGKSISPYYDY